MKFDLILNNNRANILLHYIHNIIMYIMLLIKGHDRFSQTGSILSREKLPAPAQRRDQIPVKRLGFQPRTAGEPNRLSTRIPSARTRAAVLRSPSSAYSFWS